MRAGEPPVRERLTAAYRARADLVEADRLRPPQLPEPIPPPRHRMRYALVAAAVAAVVAVPFLRGGTEAELLPEPPQTPEGAVQVDVDGDGQPDLARVDFDATAHTYLLSVRLATGRTVRYLGLAQEPPVLIGAVDLDADFADELALRVDRGINDLPVFLRFVEGNLRRLRTPPTARSVNGWQMSSDLNRFGLEKGRLYTWRFDPRRREELHRTELWRWEVVGSDRLEPGQPQRRCISGKDDFPRDCLTVLPTRQTQVVEADLDGDGLDDRVTLRFDATLDDRWVYHFDLEVRYADGRRAEVRTGSGGRPRLWEPVSIGEDGREQVLVERGGDEARPLLVYGVVRDELRLLDAPERPWLGSGPVSGGPATEVRVDGERLVSFRLLEDSGAPADRSRVEAFEWRVRGAEVRPVLLRGYCVDPRSGEFPASC